MKKLIFLLVAGFIMLISCNKDEDPYIEATIVGYDLRLCACCGGLLVDLGDDNTSDTYQWYQKNDNLGVIPGDTFPMKVKIKYHHLVQSCVASKGEIEISALKIVK